MIPMKYFSQYFLITLLFLSVSCKQNTTNQPSEKDKNNGENLELSSKTERDYLSSISKENGQNLTALEVRDLIRENPGLIIIDVRTPEEFELGSVENAINIDIYNQNFLLDIKELRMDEKYLLYCAVGGRSSAASELMENEGFTSVFNSINGFASLKEVGITIK